MKVKDLIKTLKEYSDNASVELSTVMGFDIKKEDAYEVILDLPIIGMAYNEDENCVRIVVASSKEDPWVTRLGKLRLMERDLDEEEKPDTTH
jgi:hypothetical protein